MPKPKQKPKPKTVLPHSKKAPPKPPPKPTSALPTIQSRETGAPAEIVAANVLATLPPITDDVRAAFLSQTTPAERADLGGRTKSDGVLREAGLWIAKIQSARQTFGSTAIRYRDARVAFLCESTLSLADAINRARGGRTGARTSNSRRSAALLAARRVRDDLLHTLGQIARGGPDEAAIADVERDLTHDDQLAVALKKLASIGEGWLASAATDPRIAALVSGAGLDATDMANARTAAASLSEAGAGRAVAGRALVQDTPEVNIAEGTVLAEMRAAKKAFDAGATINPAIPRLVPGPATRHVLGAHSRGPKPAPPPVPPTPVATATPSAQ